jgi:uncharacterized protein (DUF433 family)
VCGGRARIEGTRISVWFVVSNVLQQGVAPEEFVETYPHITLAQIYDALSFYYDHRDEIDRDLRDQRTAWRRHGGRKSR